MRVGVFQSDSLERSPSDRLTALDAKVQGSLLDLVVCPELFLSGYGAEVDHEHCAETPDGPFAQAVAQVARAQGTHIVYGYPERDGSTLYNAAVFIDRNGKRVANHRKTVLPPGFESERFATGANPTVFDLDGFRCALLICYEAEFPEAARAVAQDGAQLLIVPTALIDAWPTVAECMMPTRALENGVWLVYANHAGRAHGLNYLGSSCIVGPDGKDVARAGATEELISAKLSLDHVERAQQRLPYLKDLTHLPR